MRALGLIVVLVLLGCLVDARPPKGVRGQRRGQRQQQRNGTIVSQVPVLSPQERSRQRNNFIDKAGRRIVRLMDFVQGVLSNRGKQPLPAVTDNATDTEKIAVIKARRTFFSSAANTLQGLEMKTKNTFKQLKDTAKLLPVVEKPRPVNPGRRQNKFPNRKLNRPRGKQNKFINRGKPFPNRKFNRMQAIRARKGNRGVQAGKKLRKPTTAPATNNTRK